MREKIYIASAGESVDSIALKLYGDERYAKDILISNPQISGRMMLTGGERLLIPEMQNTSDREGKTISSAPWKESASKTDSDDPKKILNLVNLVAASVQNAKQEAKNAAQQAISLYRKIQSELEEGKLKGQKGDTGEQGLTGPKGDRGQKGDQGEKGDPFRYSDFTPEQLEGLRGPQGIQGNEGKRGERGQAGPQGQQGIRGEPGIPGIYYGPVQPTDEHHPVWIDPEGEPWYQLPQEEIARIAQQAAELLELYVNQLKEDLADKLPKSPADWEAWTAVEQAAARERIGIDKPVERIEELTVTEEGTTVIERTVTPTGDDYKFRRLIVCVESKQNSTTAQVTFQATSDGGKTCTITVNNLINTTNRLSQVEFFISNGVLKAMYTAPNSNGYWSGTVNTNANLMIFGSHIKKLRLYAVGGASFAVESKFTIYGVRA